MKKINKDRSLATGFFSALAGLGSRAHPPYDKGAFRNCHYENVRMNLLFCQGGLCAYTEQLLVDMRSLSERNWVSGDFDGSIKVNCSIDHYDPALKAEQGWLWSNLFAVDPYINSYVKGQKRPCDRLKPDVAGYDPSTVLDYDLEDHFFVVSGKIKSDDEYKEIQAGIRALGINDATVVARRRECVNMFLRSLDLGFPVEEPMQFVTAIAMCKGQMERFRSYYL